MQKGCPSKEAISIQSMLMSVILCLYAEFLLWELNLCFWHTTAKFLWKQWEDRECAVCVPLKTLTSTWKVYTQLLVPRVSQGENLLSPKNVHCSFPALQIEEQKKATSELTAAPRSSQHRLCSWAKCTKKAELQKGDCTQQHEEK